MVNRVGVARWKWKSEEKAKEREIEGCKRGDRVWVPRPFSSVVTGSCCTAAHPPFLCCALLLTLTFCAREHGTDNPSCCSPFLLLLPPVSSQNWIVLLFLFTYIVRRWYCMNFWLSWRSMFNLQAMYVPKLKRLRLSTRAACATDILTSSQVEKGNRPTFSLFHSQIVCKCIPFEWLSAIYS